MRTVGDHRRDSLAALRDTLNEPSALDVVLLRRGAAAAPCALYKLDGWSSLTMAPVDVMHALDLGLCRHFWTDTLTAGGLLKGPDLKRCQALLAATTYPAGMTKISTTLGDTGGGSPTAHGWSTLFRYLLPLLLALSWSESGEQEKVFSSTKRTVTSSTKGKGKAKAPRGRCQEEEPVSEEEEDNSSMASETDNEKGQDTKPPRKRKKLDKLHEHLSDLVKIFATDLHPRWLTYNYHIVLHIADQIRLHGPPRAYWAYPSERLYGLMKQIKTNRHRNGQIEFSLISRTDDRHRVATALENLPPLPLVTTMRAIIKGESRQGAKTMDDETDQGFTSSRTAKPMRLTLPQLAAVCSIANRSRPADSQPLIPLAASTPGRRENVANNMPTRLNRIDVRNSTLSPKGPAHAATSDPSFCVVRFGGQKRLANFLYAFKHSFFEEAAQTMIHNTYAQIKVLQHQDWPDRHLFSDSMWTELGYMLATRDDPQDAVISVEDIASVALTVITASIGWTRPGTIVGIPTRVAGDGRSQRVSLNIG
ncbi:hypothetical protein A4X06_0g9042 [Tilletia controversa]|uniref:DUF4218 domain-containing protein n=1 Tax=Tilletia controversa TaxID=13291 RepID=A0A8X7MJD3_9BASI|nr:hypothetical protein A4X06_0g9042 [Tilletia controversa]